MTTLAHTSDDAEIIEVGQDSITLAVIIDQGRLVIVLRARPEPGVLVRIPISNPEAEGFTRALAGSVRCVQPAPTCPACGRTARDDRGPGAVR